MREITSIEIKRVIEELKEKLVGSRLRKFYDLGEGSFRLMFYNKAGNIQIFCKLLLTFNETSFTEEAEEATPFAMGIRKRLENSTLTGISQHNSDRVIVLEFGKEGYRLIIEMLGKGNFILADMSGRIELCYRIARYKERSISPGGVYAFPKAGAIPFEEISKASVESVLERDAEGKKLIRHLSDSINIGPIYLEEIIKRSGMDPRAGLEEEKKEKLVSELLNFFKRAGADKPRIYMENGEEKDYSIVALERYRGFDYAEYDTMNELLDNLYLRKRSEEVDEERLEQKERTLANISAQKELANATEIEAESCNRAANKIFENMQGINTLIQYMRSNKRARVEEVQSAFPGIKIKGLDLKNKRVTIELKGE